MTALDPSQQRYLRRQWKPKKPYLPRWDSLPNLHQASGQHPLFVCERKSCGFSYLSPLPICVWCFWSSEKASKEFEVVATSRRRRVTSPTLVSNIQPCSLSRLSIRETAATPPFDTVWIRPELSQETIAEVPFDGHSSSSSVDLVEIPPTPVSESQETTVQLSSPYGCVDRTHRTEITVMNPTNPSMKSSRPVAEHLVVDLVNIPSPNLHSPVRVLRRKGHIPLSRQSAPPAMSPSDSTEFRLSLRESITSCPPYVPITKLQTHYRSHSYPTTGSNPNNARLGHPSRPYYSAIRKNMSSPDTASLISSSRASSPSLYGPRLPTLALDDSDYFGAGGDDDTPFLSPPSLVLSPSSLLSPPRTSSTHVVSASPRSKFFGPLSGGANSVTSGGGFSLSGETEMRMLLSRGSQPEGKVYKFKETWKLTTSGKSSPTVKQHVKRFRRGFVKLLKIT